MVMAPLMVPLFVGVKVTEKVHFALAARLDPQGVVFPGSIEEFPLATTFRRLVCTLWLLVMVIAQQLREAFPYQSAPKFLIFDHDAKYGWEVPAAIRSMKIVPTQTAIRSPWQNGIAERWVGSCRRDLLDHVIALNERHLKRLLFEYVSYFLHRANSGAMR